MGANLAGQWPSRREETVVSSASYYQSRRAGHGVRPSVSAGTLWAGGLATAVVAAFGYAVGVVIARGVFDVPVLAPERAGLTGDESTWWFAGLAFVAALLATALMHLLLVATPRPFAFFGWIVGLATTLVTVLPFTQRAELAAQIATAIINLVIGIMIGTLLRGVAARAVRPVRVATPYAGPPLVEGPTIVGGADGVGEMPGYNNGYSPSRAPDYRAMGDPFVD
jgi:hypothetical protein